MTIKTQEEELINELAHKIVIDHFIKTLCTETLKLTNTVTLDIINEVINRESMVLDVLNLNTQKTYKKLLADKINVGPLIDDLKKQIFLEMCIKEDFNQAVEVGKDLYNSSSLNDIELFSIIGNKKKLEFLKKNESVERRSWLAECLNEEMCYYMFKQRKSQVWILFNQMNAIMHYDN